MSQGADKISSQNQKSICCTRMVPPKQVKDPKIHHKESQRLYTQGKKMKEMEKYLAEWN